MNPIYLGLAIANRYARGIYNVRAPDQPREWALDPANVQKVVDGMYAVVNEGGTGGRARLPGIEVCGKTGTAQLASNVFLKGRAQTQAMKDNAWFVGFAPRVSPEIVVVALFEGGQHGQLAAPIVRDVLKAYFDKKARLAGPPPQIASITPQILAAPTVTPPQAAPGAPANP